MGFLSYSLRYCVFALGVSCLCCRDLRFPRLPCMVLPTSKALRYNGIFICIVEFEPISHSFTLEVSRSDTFHFFVRLPCVASSGSVLLRSYFCAVAPYFCAVASYIRSVSPYVYAVASFVRAVASYVCAVGREEANSVDIGGS